MVTTEVFENLKSLQEILVQKYELEGKKSDAPKQLSNQEDLLAKTQKEFIEQKSNYDATQEKVTQLKAQLEEAVKSRKKVKRESQTLQLTVNTKLSKSRLQKQSFLKSRFAKIFSTKKKTLQNSTKDLRTLKNLSNSRKANLIQAAIL